MNSAQKKLDYGTDAPRVIRNLVVAGVALISASRLPNFTIAHVQFDLRGLIYSGVSCLVGAVLMVIYVKHGKFKHRDRMLAKISWRGDERVLDVGTGRGLLMIGAAKKLSTGKSIGIDIWSKVDLSGNSKDATLHNAKLEGVEDKVEVQDGDTRKMNFPDATFDVVVSNLCIHNISRREDRDLACREIVRVLKPGGRAVISDFRNTAQYVKAFRDAEASVTRSAMYWGDTFPPLRIIEVK